MASLTCHVAGVTKQVRLERIVRPNHSPSIIEAFGFGQKETRNRRVINTAAIIETGSQIIDDNPKNQLRYSLSRPDEFLRIDSVNSNGPHAMIKKIDAAIHINADFLGSDTANAHRMSTDLITMMSPKRA